MKGKIKMTMVLSTILFILGAFVFASTITINPVVVRTNASQYTVIINTTGELSNVSGVTITFPSFLTYISGSNSTNAVNTSFSNGTTSLFWSNTTNQGFIPNGTTRLFYFNLSGVNDTSFNISTFVNFTNGSQSSTTNTLIIMDNIYPDIYFNYPLSSNKAYLKPNQNLSLNLTFNESSPLNLTLEVSNSSWSSILYTNTSLVSSTNKVTMLESVNIGALDDGIYNLTLRIYDDVNNTNYTIQTSSLVVDNSTPVISLEYPSNNSWVPLGNVTFNYTPYSLSNISNCTINIYNSSSVLNSSTTDNSITNNATNSFVNASYLSEGAYFWNITCYNTVNTSASSSTYKLNVGNRADLVVTKINLDKSKPQDNDNITISVTVLNNGTSDMTNTTNLGFYFGTNSNPCSQTPTNTSVVLSGISKGSSQTFNYTILDLNKTTYYICAKADYASNETETSESNNEMSSSFSTLLNVTILELNYSSGSSVKPGNDVVLRVNVTYYDGTPVTGLTLNNFTLRDKWVEVSGHSYVDRTSSLKVNDFTGNTSGIYIFNYTVKSHTSGANNGDDPEYKTHTIELNATSGNHTGSDTINYEYRSPYLKITWSNEPSSIEDGKDSTSPKFKVENLGNEDINIENYIISGTSSLSASLYSCTIPSKIVAGGSDTCNVKITGKSVDSNEKISVNVTGNATDPTRHYNLKVSSAGIDVVEPATTTSTNSGSSDTTNTPGSEEGEEGDFCTADNDCKDDLYCTSSHKCEAVSCSEGTVVDHVCKTTKKITWTYTKSKEIMQGRNATIDVKIKNTGYVSLTNIDFNVLDSYGNESSWFEIEGVPSSLSVGAQKTITLSISVPEDAEVKTHSFKLKLTSKQQSFEEQLSVLVAPTNDTAELIKTEILTLKSNITEIEELFEEIKDELSEENRSYFEGKLNKIRLLYNETLKDINSSNYISANSGKAEILKEISSLKEQLSEQEEKISSGLWSKLMWSFIILLIIAGLGGAFYYLWVPPKNEYDPVADIYGKTKKKKLKDKLKEKIKKKDNKQTTVYQYRPKVK